MKLSVTIPLRLVSEANRREHWHVKAKRVAEHRAIARMAIIAATTDAYRRQFFSDIVITRIAPRALDGDNAYGACKACRDGVADALAIDDHESVGVAWTVRQEKGKPGEYAVRVELFPVVWVYGAECFGVACEEAV